MGVAGHCCGRVLGGPRIRITNGSVRYNTTIAGLDSHWSSSSIQTVDPIQSKSTGRLDPIQPNPIQFAANPTRSLHQSSIPTLTWCRYYPAARLIRLSLLPLTLLCNLFVLCAYSRAIMSSSRAPSPVPSTSQSLPSRPPPTRVDDGPNFTPATSEATPDDERILHKANLILIGRISGTN